ncbi:MAG TPA: four helix bundle protein [Gemmatimonadaceae bacterium]|nr:four helix bundle protein [Gemmatimonadaceae bacterium]
MQDFRRLQVWTRANAHTIAVRRATSRFPRRGFAELKDQIHRSAESIVNNIVEGCGAATDPEFARFLSMSIKSAIELEGQLEMARGYEILADAVWRQLAGETVEIRRMLFGLRKSVLNRPPRKQRDPIPQSVDRSEIRDDASQG